MPITSFDTGKFSSITTPTPELPELPDPKFKSALDDSAEFSPFKSKTSDPFRLNIFPEPTNKPSPELPDPEFKSALDDSAEFNPFKSKSSNPFRLDIFPEPTNKPFSPKFMSAQKAVVTALLARLPTLEKQARAEAEAAGLVFDPVSFRAEMSDVVSVYLDAITAVAGSSASSIADIQSLVGDLELIEGEENLTTTDGRNVFGVALMDSESGPAKILLNTVLEGDPELLRETAIEELSERMYQEIAGDFSVGDFGAEVSARIAGTITKAEIAELRTEAADDTVEIEGFGTGEAAVGDEPTNSEVLRNIFGNLLEEDAATVDVITNVVGDGVETTIANLGVYGGAFRPNGFLTVLSVRDGEIMEQRVPIDERGIARVEAAEIIEYDGEYVDDWDILESDVGNFVMFQDGGKAMPDIAFYANTKTGELTHLSSETVGEYAEIMNTGLRFWDEGDITLERSFDYGDGSGDVVDGFGIRAMITETGVGDMLLNTGGYFYSSNVLTGDDLTASYEESEKLALRLIRGDATVADFDQIDDDALALGTRLEAQFRVNVERVLEETSTPINFQIPDNAGSVELRNASQDMLIQGQEMIRSMGIVYGQLAQMIIDMEGAGMSQSVMDGIMADVTNGTFLSVGELEVHIDEWVGGVEQAKSTMISQITEILPSIIDAEERSAALNQLFMVLTVIDVATSAGTILQDLGKLWAKNRKYKALLAETKAKNQEELENDPDFLKNLEQLGLTPATWKTYVEFSKKKPEKMLPSSMTPQQIDDVALQDARVIANRKVQEARDEQDMDFLDEQVALDENDPRRRSKVEYTGDAARDVDEDGNAVPTAEEIATEKTRILDENKPTENPDYWKEVEEYYKDLAKNADDKEDLFSLFSMLKNGIAMITTPTLLQTRILDANGEAVYLNTDYQPDFATMTAYAAESYLNTLPEWEVSDDVARAVSASTAVMQNTFEDFKGSLAIDLNDRFDTPVFDTKVSEIEADSPFKEEVNRVFGDLFSQGFNIDSSHYKYEMEEQNIFIDRAKEEDEVMKSMALKMQMDYNMFMELSKLKEEYGDDLLERYVVTGRVNEQRKFTEGEWMPVDSYGYTENGKNYFGTFSEYIDFEGVSMQLLPVKAEGFVTEKDVMRVPRFYMQPGSLMFDVIKDHVEMDVNSPNYGMMKNASAFYPPNWWQEFKNNDDYNSGRLDMYFDPETSLNIDDFGPLITPTTFVPIETKPAPVV